MIRPASAAMLLIVACSGAQQPPTTSSDPPSTTSLVTEAPTTTSTEPVATTTTTTQVDEPWREPLQGKLPTLDDGRPATFLAVNRDYAAVEVDTATGAVIRMIAQVSTAEDVENAECSACVNAVDAIWRLADGSAYLVSECCEPAAGSMYWLKPGEQVTSENQPQQVIFNWYGAASPTTRAMAVSGYRPAIVSPDAVADESPMWSWETGQEWYAHSPPAWNRELNLLQVLGGDNLNITQLWTFELATSEATSISLSWLGGDQYISGLGTQVSGRIVTFRLTDDGDEDIENDLARGIVFEPTGELVAEFDLEPGSKMGGYDPSGQFLIYVDGSGTARWQGFGQTGVLGEGYTFASW